GQNEKAAVQFTVKNTGSRSGAEVAQLYVRMPDGLHEPPAQLKGFEKVALRPGESRTVSLPLPAASLQLYDEETGSWRVFGGEYNVMVGSSSRDIRLRSRMLVPVD